ncbi:MAG: hypothetical protein ABIK92_12560 [Pseudomonadota bacterium]
MMSNRKFRCYLLFVIISFVFCGCSGDVDKAKDFVSAGMSPQAIELLNKRIKEKPTDAEAQFQLGICYINTGDFSNAKDRFASAVQLKSDYGYKIGPEYKKAGSQALAKGDMSRAVGLYRQAVQYQAGLKNDIGAELFAEGKTLFEKGQHKPAENYFMSAASINPALKETVADYYFQAGNKTDIPTDSKTVFFDTAVKFSQKNKYTEAQKKQNEALGEEYYSKAQAIQVPDGGIMSVEERQNLINLLSQKVGLLNKACQYTSRYRAEYEECLARLEMERAVAKYESQWGPAKVVRLTKSGDWKEACVISSGDHISYLSLKEFKEKDNVDGISTWRSSFNKINGFDIYGSKNIRIEFSISREPTDIYFWINKS